MDPVCWLSLFLFSLPLGGYLLLPSPCPWWLSLFLFSPCPWRWLLPRWWWRAAWLPVLLVLVLVILILIVPVPVFARVFFISWVLIGSCFLLFCLRFCRCWGSSAQDSRYGSLLYEWGFDRAWDLLARERLPSAWLGSKERGKEEGFRRIIAAGCPTRFLFSMLGSDLWFFLCCMDSSSPEQARRL